jgi:rfaE bifunctional protein nucleotidyltransferase chain/domain
MAFVLVQHLAPDHKSILTDLVRRYTRMQVYEVEDGMAVQPNCTYIIPPNRDMAFLNGALHLLEQTSPRGMRLPIDFFFCSLVQDQRERAIGIVLSGTGSDGTQGVRAIKGEKRPLVPQGERAEVVASLMSVDYVTLFDEATPLRLIEYLRPDVLVKGGDWQEEQIVGRDAVRSWGGRVVICAMTEGASTTNIVEKVLQVYGKG